MITVQAFIHLVIHNCIYVFMLANIHFLILDARLKNARLSKSEKEIVTDLTDYRFEFQKRMFSVRIFVFNRSVKL